MLYDNNKLKINRNLNSCVCNAFNFGDFSIYLASSKN